METIENLTELPKPEFNEVIALSVERFECGQESVLNRVVNNLIENNELGIG